MNEDKLKEVASGIVEKFVDSGHIYDEEFEKVTRAIYKAILQSCDEALLEAEKVARDEGRCESICDCGNNIANGIAKLRNGQKGRG
jgi:hypothetical protein